MGNKMKSSDFRHGQPSQAHRDASEYVPDLAEMIERSTISKSELRELVERFSSDRDALLRFYHK